MVGLLDEDADWHGAFDALSEQLQLPPLTLRAHLDAKHREMVRWRDLARALAHELERDEQARDLRDAAAPPDEPGP
jgi:uncharacterized membrane protein YccC